LLGVKYVVYLTYCVANPINHQFLEKYWDSIERNPPPENSQQYMIDEVYTSAMDLSLGWLALEVKYLDPSASFYRRHLDLPVVRETDTEIAFAAGDTDLVLRSPSTVPRGGLHTHYALSTPAAEYSDWWDRLSPHFDLTEFEFGTSKSLYFYDTEGNCVEIGQSDDDESKGESETITGVFEIVLEVESLDRAESFYTALGCDVVDRGDERKRIRLTAGSFDIELWEPQLGIADARGGVHVDLGIETDDPNTLLDRIDTQAISVEELDDGFRVKDPDGHYVTIS
jgi:catechol-2,3-dioxygenase